MKMIATGMTTLLFILALAGPTTVAADQAAQAEQAGAEYLPVMKAQPRFPGKALRKGLEGWVLVEFTVLPDGSVADPRVIENCARKNIAAPIDECQSSPDKVFDRNALKAAAKFKYEPRVVDGQPIAVEGVQNRITFELM